MRRQRPVVAPILVIIALCACSPAPLSPSARGSQSADPAATAAATRTPRPTPSVEPSATPEPDPTVAPTPSAAPPVLGGRPIGSFLPCDRPVTPPRCVSVGDDSRQYVYIDASVPAGLADSIRQAISAVYDPTNLVVVEQDAVTSLTDAIAYAADYGQNGAAGWTYCPPSAPQGVNAQGDRWCRHQEVHFNLNPRYAVFFADDASRDHLACHELGHTLGLLHWGNPPHSDPPVAATCMNSDTPDGPTDLHEFDRARINAYYPAP